MIGLIARRELLGHLRSPRYRALLALVVALLAAGTYANVRRYQERVRYADALEVLRALTVATATSDPERVASRYGWHGGRIAADPALRAIRAPIPASILATGNELTIPAYWQLGTEGVSAGRLDENESAGAALDLESVTRIMLSLVALLLAADAIAGERERGTLRALFAAPVSRTDVLLGKYVGGLLALCVPLGLGLIVAMSIAASLHAPIAASGLLPRLVLLALGAAVYLAAMLALGIAVSACCRDTQSAVVVLVALWATIVVVIPGIGAAVAGVARPVMPVELYLQSRAEALAQLEAERARALAGVWRRVAGRPDVPLDGAIDPATRGAYDRARAPLDATLMRRKRALLRESLGARRREVAARARIESALGTLSPASSFAALAAEIAGTGTASRERWEHAVDDQQRRLEVAVFDRSFGTELFAANAGYLRISYLPNDADPKERVPRYDELPAFAAPSPNLAADLRAAVPALTVLLAQGVICLAGGVVAVTRMEA